jgi:hypothetical protein
VPELAQQRVGRLAGERAHVKGFQLWAVLPERVEHGGQRRTGLSDLGGPLGPPACAGAAADGCAPRAQALHKLALLASPPSEDQERILVKARKRIDLLAIDGRGDLYVIELKRDRTPREVVAQAPARRD